MSNTPPPILHVVQASYGDCFVLEYGATSARTYWLIDGGPGNQSRSATYKVTNNHLFRALNRINGGISELERLIVTHNDRDHTYGASAMLETLVNKAKHEGVAAADVAYLDYVAWHKGFLKLNANPPTFPIGQIWFNDKAKLDETWNHNSKAKGWMDLLVAKLEEDYELVIQYNDDMKNSLVGVGEAVDNFPKTTKIIGPTETALYNLWNGGGVKSGALPQWRATAESFKKSKKTIAWPASIKTWYGMDQANKEGDDDSITNLSSIMFAFMSAKTSILLTGDGDGASINADPAYKDESEVKFDILKMMHHGSSNNCLLRLADGETLADATKNFFAKFKANKYVISADTLNRTPNPDLATLRGMANALNNDTTPRRLYLTNGLTYRSYREIKFSDVADDNIGTTFRANPLAVCLLNPKDKVDWGSVVASMDKSVMLSLEGNWLEVDQDAYNQYFFIRMKQYFSSLIDDSIQDPVAKYDDLQKKLFKIAKNAAVKALKKDVFGRRRGRAITMTTARRRSTRIRRSTTFAMKSQKNFIRLAATTPPLARLTPAPHRTWHDVMIANLIDITDLTLLSLEQQAPSIPVPLAQVPGDGFTASWVDLPTLIALIDKCNTEFVPTADNPRLDANYIARLKYWFVNPNDPTQPQPLIVASMLLNMLLTEEIAAELFVALPLNPSGTVPFSPFAATTTTTPPEAAMMTMLIQNFRAQVIVPTAAQLAQGATVEVASLYFELDSPPSGLDPTVTGANFFLWTLPFSNGLWAPGQATFHHASPLKINMLWPFYANAVTICQYDTQLQITRSTTPVTLPAAGTMYLARGAAASHDIQFKGDPKGQVKAMDLLNLFAPSASEAVTLLEELASNLAIPGIDLTKVINNDVVLQDAGIILQQHESMITTTAIESLYGTISTSQVLQLAVDLLPFPSSFSVPQNLPALTVTISNVVGYNRQYGFAFSQEVPNIGTVALEVSEGGDDQPQIDLWVINDNNISVAQMLDQAGVTDLLSQFQAASVFTDAVSHLTVPYAHLSFGPSQLYTSDVKYSTRQLTVAIELDDISIPSSNPVIVVENLSLEIQHKSPEQSTPASMAVFGTATMRLGYADAICVFTIDHNVDAMSTFLAEGQGDDHDPTATANAAIPPSPSGFQGYLDLNISFEGEGPSIGDIINTFVGEALDAAGLNTLTQNIPTQLLSILDSNDFQAVEMRLQKTSTTNAEWEIMYLHIQVRLDGLQSVLNILPKANFEKPFLDVVMRYPSDPNQRSYEVSLSSATWLGSGLCTFSASFDSPPPGFVRNTNSMITVGLTANAAYQGLPIGTVVDQFADKTLSALGITNSIPQQVQDIFSVEIDQAMLSFANVSNEWKMKFVEVAATSAAAAWKPFESFQISNVQVHFSRDTGIDGTQPDTIVEFNANLTVGSNNIQAGFTYDTIKGWSLTFHADQTINLVDLIINGLDGIGFTIPQTIQSSIESILVIDTDSFYLSYSQNPESFCFSNDGNITLFNIGVSNISVYCSKTEGTWSYTVSLALPSPCEPLNAFSGIPFLGGIQIINGQFAFVKGQPSAQALGTTTLPPNANESSIMLSGTIVLAGSQFMDLISNIIKLDQVYVCILPGAVTIAIPAGATGLNIMNVFKVKTFSLDIMLTGFGLGATVELNASWLSQTPIDATFTLIIQDDGAFGASIAISEIIEPFGLPGVALEQSSFTLVWLAEAMEPQSLGAKASVVLTEPGADKIVAGFDMLMDELNPTNNYFKIDVENLTLPNLIQAMTHGALPSPLNSNILKIGFKELLIDLEPASLNFTLNADFYIFALEGKVQASVNITTGISFGANFDPVNVLGLITLSAYHDTSHGPFVYLDTTIKDLASGTQGPPAWIGVTSANDPNLKGAAFAVSSSLKFLGTNLDIYGVINTKGLELVVHSSENLGYPGTKFQLTEDFDISINAQQLSAGTGFEFQFGLQLPDISVFGISLGSFDGTLVDLKDKIQVTVQYNETNWEDDNLDFYVAINADILGLDLKEHLDLDITIQSISQLPGAIESFVTDQVVHYLEDKIAAPFEALWNDAVAAANEAAAALKDEWNTISSDVVGLLTEAGHELAAIADALKNTLGMTIDEVASTFVDLGHDVQDIGDAIGSAFNAGAMEVFSGLASAGVTVEHALSTAFGDAASEVSKDFNLVGNSVASVATDAVSLVENIAGDVADDVASFSTTAISDVGNFFEGAGESFVGFFHSSCVVI